MYPNLKLQIFRRGSHQNKLARAVGIDETVLSKIIHGYRAPTQAQRKILAIHLEADEAWLFERFEVGSQVNNPPRIQDAGTDGATENGDA